MRAVIQRVQRASVTVNGEITGKIEKGLAVLLGVMGDDSEKESAYLAKKLCELRIFTDENDKMNLSVMDVDGDVLVISQFTLGADCSHGRRPSFIAAARPETAIPLYEHFVKGVCDITKKPPQTGVFGEHMDFELINDGPVTIIFDTKDMM